MTIMVWAGNYSKAFCLVGMYRRKSNLGKHAPKQRCVCRLNEMKPQQFYEGCCSSYSVRVIRFMSRSFNLTSTQPTAATNKDAAATADLRGIPEDSHSQNLTLTILAMDTIRGRCSHFIR